MASESRPGPTPNGGVRSTAYYQDDAGKDAEKADATRVVIVEYDAGGKEIQRTYGTLPGAGK